MSPCTTSCLQCFSTKGQTPLSAVWLLKAHYTSITVSWSAGHHPEQQSPSICAPIWLSAIWLCPVAVFTDFNEPLWRLVHVYIHCCHSLAFKVLGSILIVEKHALGMYCTCARVNPQLYHRDLNCTFWTSEIFWWNHLKINCMNVVLLVEFST